MALLSWRRAGRIGSLLLGVRPRRRRVGLTENAAAGVPRSAHSPQPTLCEGCMNGEHRGI
jgi:hypothetical protein